MWRDSVGVPQNQPRRSLLAGFCGINSERLEGSGRVFSLLTPTANFFMNPGDRNIFSVLRGYRIPRTDNPTQDINFISPLARVQPRDMREDSLDPIVSGILRQPHAMSDSEMDAQEFPATQGYKDVSPAESVVSEGEDHGDDFSQGSNEELNTSVWCEQEVEDDLTPAEIHTPDPVGLTQAAATVVPAAVPAVQPVIVAENPPAAAAAAAPEGQADAVVPQRGAAVPIVAPMGPRGDAAAQPPDGGTVRPGGGLLAAYMVPRNEGWDPTGPEICDTLKQLVEALWDQPLKRQQAGELYAKYKRPANIDVLRKTTLNPELLRTLPKKARETDGMLAGIQWGIQYASTPLVRILDSLEKGEVVSQEVVIAKVVDSLKLLGRTAGLTNNFRRESLCPLLIRGFQGVLNNDGSQG